MARLQIEIPPTVIFSIDIPVRISDVNYGNHLGNDHLVSILHEARMAWLMSLGYSELNIGGVGIIMSDLQVEYINEAFYADMLTIKISTGIPGRVNVDLYYEVSTIRNETPKIVAKAKTGLVCYNYETRKVASVPEAFRSVLNK